MLPTQAGSLPACAAASGTIARSKAKPVRAGRCFGNIDAAVRMISCSRDEQRAQLAFQDLAIGIARQWLEAELDLGRHLEGGEALGDMPLQLLGADPRTGLHLHDGADFLAEDAVRDADHRRVHDGGMAEERILDLDAIDVLAAPDEHVLDAIEDVEKALLVAAYEVAAAQPAIGEARRRRLAVVPIAFDDIGSLDPELADRAIGDILARGVDDAQIADGNGEPGAV